MVYHNTKDFIDLERIGCVWGIVEALLNLLVMAYFLWNSDGLIIRILAIAIDFRGFFINILIFKLFSSVLLALGSALVSIEFVFAFH